MTSQLTGRPAVGVDPTSPRVDNHEITKEVAALNSIIKQLLLLEPDARLRVIGACTIMVRPPKP